LKLNFTQIPIVNLVGRVFESEDRVLFSYVDAYGHLNSAKYLEMVINHRVHALEEQICCFTLDILKETGVAFVIASTQMDFHRPSFQSEILVIQSWVGQLQEVDFLVNFKIFEKKTRKTRSSGVLKCVSVDLKTHKPCAIPKTLPSRGDLSDVLKLPLKT
jgi:YbgC/YbaW family acyl-CoA thioester hydrolase